MNDLNGVMHRLRIWSDPDNRLREKALEALLLLDLFRGSLGYGRESAVSQPRKNDRVADIALKPAIRKRSDWVIVEIKRPGAKLATPQLQQAGKYALIFKARRAILTNGKEWIFARIKERPRAKYVFHIEVLMRFCLPCLSEPERRCAIVS